MVKQEVLKRMIEETSFTIYVSVSIYMYILTPWLMEPGGSVPHSQGLSNNPYPEPNHPNSSY